MEQTEKKRYIEIIRQDANSITISKDDAIDLVNDDVWEDDPVQPIERNFVEHNRWSLTYRIVIRYDQRYYAQTYRNAATETQDESPFENDGPEIRFNEVKVKRKLVTVYE